MKTGEDLFFFVGMRRFELPTSSTPCWRDTGLRYIPNNNRINYLCKYKRCANN